MDTTAMVEIAKLGLQIFFAMMQQANLTAEEELALLNVERERFKTSQAVPLPDV